jgi:hypothetical protein
MSDVMGCKPNTVSGYLTKATTWLREVATPSAVDREELGLKL